MLWILALVVVTALAAYLRKGYFRGRPYWLDEAWVVDSVRASPWRVFRMSSTSPPLWEMMLRFVPTIGGPERHRVVPFLLSVGTVAPAAAIGAALGARPRQRLGYALGAALAVAVLPHMIVRQDLKQFTAEAFIALGMLWLIARMEQTWTWRRLVVAGAVAVPAVLIASNALFVALAAFGSLCLCLLIDGRRRESVATGVAAIIVAGLNVALLSWASPYGPGGGLQDYWKKDFIPVDRGMGQAFHFVRVRIGREFGYTHLPTALFVALIVVGIAVLWANRRRVLAMAGPVLLGGLAIAAALKIYPFLDRRTSLFLMAILAIDAAVGVVWLVRLVARSMPGVAIAVAGVAALAVPLRAADVAALKPSTPYENVRDQVTYIERHRARGDVIVVGFPASFGFAYYWRDPPTFVPQPRPEPLVTFAVTYPRDRSIVVASYRGYRDIRAALEGGLSRAAHGDAVWVVLSHDTPAAWTALIPNDVRVERITLRLGPTDALLRLTRSP